MKWMKVAVIWSVACLINFFVGFHAFAVQIDLLASLNGNKLMGKFNQPFALFFDERKKKLYVADTGNNRIVSFNDEFEYIADFNAGGELKHPKSLVKNSRDEFFLTGEEGGNELFIVDVARKIFRQFKITGAPQRVNPILPGRLAIDKDDNLYLVDKGNGRILVLDREGLFIREILFKDRFVDFSDVRVGSDGNIYLLSALERKVYIFNNKGKLLSSFGKRGNKKHEFAFPISIALDNRGIIYVLDQHKGSVMAFKKNGDFLDSFFKTGWIPEELYRPYYLWMDSENNLYIADKGNNRIQVFHIKMK